MMAYIKKSIIHTYSWQGFTCNIYTCICVYCILLTSVWMSMTTQCAWWKLNFAEMCMDKLNFDKDQFNQMCDNICRCRNKMDERKAVRCWGEEKWPTPLCQQQGVDPSGRMVIEVTHPISPFTPSPQPHSPSHL